MPVKAAAPITVAPVMAVTLTPAVAVASNEVGATPVVKLVEVGRLPSGLE